MQRPEPLATSHHTLVRPLRRALGARALGAALLASAVPACGDLLDDLEALRDEVVPAASVPDAGPDQAEPPRAAPRPEAPAPDPTSPSTDDAPPDPTSPSTDDAQPSDRGEVCVDACEFSFDGECDDGRPGSETDLCQPNTDCADCGSSASNEPAPADDEAVAAFDDVALSWERATPSATATLRVASTLVLCNSGLVLLFEDELEPGGDVSRGFASVGFDWSLRAGADGQTLDASFALSDRDVPEAPFSRSLRLELDAAGAPTRVDGDAIIGVEDVGTECLVEASLMREDCERGAGDAALQAACEAGRAAGVL